MADTGSPFSGMDPYLERYWGDVHTSLATDIRNELNRHLPDALVARAEERTEIRVAGQPPRRVVPDVRVRERVEYFGSSEQAGAGVATAGGETLILAPFKLRAIEEPATQRYVKIIDPDGDRVVTVIELVSPSNKVGEGLREFRRKREELLDGGVNVVEIDLVRTGSRVELVAPDEIPPDADATYATLIHVPFPDRQTWYHPMPLREPLPTIKIPLRPTDQPAELALQPLIDAAYRNGRYGRTIDYTRALEPPLDPEDAAWFEERRRGSSESPVVGA